MLLWLTAPFSIPKHSSPRVVIGVLPKCLILPCLPLTFCESCTYSQGVYVLVYPLFLVGFGVFWAFPFLFSYLRISEMFSRCPPFDTHQMKEILFFLVLKKIIKVSWDRCCGVCAYMALYGPENMSLVEEAWLSVLIISSLLNNLFEKITIKSYQKGALVT